MKLAILGAGNVGMALAVLAGSRGHEVRMWSRSMQRQALGCTREIVARGALEGRMLVRCEASMRDAVSGADAVVVAVPAYGQHMVIDALVPLISHGQSVLLSPAPSASALVLANAAAARGVQAMVAGTSTSLLTARAHPEDDVHVGVLRSEVGLASVQPSDYEAVSSIYNRLFGTRFARLQSALAASLAFVTPVVHSAMILGNLSRVERQETWAQFDCTTPAIARLSEAMDEERLRLAAHRGIKIPSLLEHCTASFGVPARDYYDFCQVSARARNGGPPGPTSLGSRYVTEDVPFGLVFFSRMARADGIAVPLIDACIAIMSGVCNRDFAKDNSLLPLLQGEHFARG